MSYMNHLEKKLRYSNAFSSINALRNRIGFNDHAAIEPAERDIILDAVEIATDNSDKSFKKALLYGFHNTGNSLQTSALELGKVIITGLERQVITPDDVAAIRSILLQEEPVERDLQALIPKIDNLMILLNKAKKDEVPGSNLFLKKS